MNFKAIKRAEELRLNIERQDKEIIELERIMLNLATQDGQALTMSLAVSNPITPVAGTGHNFKPGGLPTKSINTPYDSMMVFDIEAGNMDGIFKSVQEAAGNMDGIFKSVQEAAGNMGHLPESKEQIIPKPTKSTFVLTNVMALEFLTIYHQRLTDERALAFKLLEECIKSLKVII